MHVDDLEFCGCLPLAPQIFAVMTDTFHKPGFKMHARILHHMFDVVGRPAVIAVPLWDVNVSAPTAPTCMRSWRC